MNTQTSHAEVKGPGAAKISHVSPVFKGIGGQIMRERHDMLIGAGRGKPELCGEQTDRAPQPAQSTGARKSGVRHTIKLNELVLSKGWKKKTKKE